MGIYYGFESSTGTYCLVRQNKPPTGLLFFVITGNTIVFNILEMGKGFLYQSTNSRSDINMCSEYFVFFKAPLALG